MDDNEYALRRERMVRIQISERGITDPRVLNAMRSVPRHLFFPPAERQEAYADHAAPIGLGQTISQPYIVALMTELLGLLGGETVLEVGTGSGYQAAVLAQIAGHVISLERYPELAERAGQVLAEIGIANVEIHCMDGSGGYKPEAPYGGILVTAAAPRVPQPLLEQLAAGARLVLPVAEGYGQVIQVWQKDEYSDLSHRDDIPVAFVPLRGEWGYE
jgi:protein-L-isoaspartate(D-aspartate) O-methyltransferase